MRRPTPACIAPAPHGAKPCPVGYCPESPPAPTALDRRSAMRALVADARGNHTWLPAAGGVPDGIRSDHGPELMAAATRDRLARASAETLYPEPGSARQKGYAASSNIKPRDQPPGREILYRRRRRRPDGLPTLPQCLPDSHSRWYKDRTRSTGVSLLT